MEESVKKTEAAIEAVLFSMGDAVELTQAFAWLVEHERQVRDHLSSTIPAYKAGIVPAVSAVRSLCKK